MNLTLAKDLDFTDENREVWLWNHEKTHLGYNDERKH